MGTPELRARRIDESVAAGTVYDAVAQADKIRRVRDTMRGVGAFTVERLNERSKPQGLGAKMGSSALDGANVNRG